MPLHASFWQVKHRQHLFLLFIVADSLNNYPFEVERSADGMNFNSLGFVSSPYNTSSIDVEYRFIDKHPNNGVNFYRLKQVKSSGNIFYSNIVALKFENPVITILSINPNPVSTTVNIICNSQEATPVSVKFYSGGGRIVKEISTRFTKGSNTVSEDVSILPTGVYFIVLSRPNERLSEGKFVKQ